MEKKRYNIPDSDITLEVSSDGKTVVVLDRYVTQKTSAGKKYRRFQKGRILSQTSNEAGYLQVKVSYRNNTIRYYVHRLVWLVFIGEIPEGYEIAHIDNDKSNCCIDNLHLVLDNKV